MSSPILTIKIIPQLRTIFTNSFSTLKSHRPNSFQMMRTGFNQKNPQIIYSAAKMMQHNNSPYKQFLNKCLNLHQQDLNSFVDSINKQCFQKVWILMSFIGLLQFYCHQQLHTFLNKSTYLKLFRNYKHFFVDSNNQLIKPPKNATLMIPHYAYISEPNFKSEVRLLNPQIIKSVICNSNSNDRVKVLIRLLSDDIYCINDQALLFEIMSQTIEHLNVPSSISDIQFLILVLAKFNQIPFYYLKHIIELVHNKIDQLKNKKQSFLEIISFANLLVVLEKCNRINVLQIEKIHQKIKFLYHLLLQYCNLTQRLKNPSEYLSMVESTVEEQIEMLTKYQINILQNIENSQCMINPSSIFFNKVMASRCKEIFLLHSNRKLHTRASIRIIRMILLGFKMDLYTDTEKQIIMCHPISKQIWNHIICFGDILAQTTYALQGLNKQCYEIIEPAQRQFNRILGNPTEIISGNPIEVAHTNHDYLLQTHTTVNQLLNCLVKMQSEYALSYFNIRNCLKNNIMFQYSLLKYAAKRYIYEMNKQQIHDHWDYPYYYEFKITNHRGQNLLIQLIGGCRPKMQLLNNNSKDTDKVVQVKYLEFRKILSMIKQFRL